MSCLFKDAFVLRCMEEVEIAKGRVLACEERSFLVLGFHFSFHIYLFFIWCILHHFPNPKTKKLIASH